MKHKHKEFNELSADEQIHWVEKVRKACGGQLSSKEAFRYAEDEYKESLESERKSAGLVTYAIESSMAMIAAIHSKISMKEIRALWVSEDYIDFLGEVGTFAELSARIAFECAEQDIEFPGVYIYDVDMEFGEYMASEIIAKTYTIEGAKAKLIRLIEEYFSVRQDDEKVTSKVKEIISLLIGHNSSHSLANAA